MRREMSVALFCLWNVVLTGIVEKERFPDIEIHSGERQIFTLSDYFMGKDLRFSLGGKNSHLSFEASRKICSIDFSSAGKDAFLLDPSTGSDLQILFILHSNLTLGMYKMNNVCDPDVVGINLLSWVAQENFTLVDASKIYSYHNRSEIICTINSVLDRNNWRAEYLIIFKIFSSNITMKIEPFGELANFTSLEHKDMMVVYSRCFERGICGTRHNPEYAIYIYLMRGQKLQEYAPFLIAKMDASFFGQQSIAINTIQSSYESILISDIENSVVYRVEITQLTRIPELVATYIFPTRIDSICVLPYLENHCFVSSRLGPRKSGQVYNLVDDSVIQLVDDLANETEDPQHSAENYIIQSSCSIRNFHISVINNVLNSSEHIIRIVSFHPSYVSYESYESKILYLDCYIYSSNYVLVIQENGYTMLYPIRCSNSTGELLI